ncbi:hypothetical protein DWB85_18465 [Seongchinamella sediminis]|uniref:Sacsin/Nov domain-containing protein n=1 Tax=Seongchinamella sediminis TaxID=2283635 RepID=A0A3L7DS73_9GAMM|nr:ATP-binding protein [Seongchinamella sediminis]RLQ20274.1 hypothetical protein DWB85_18465 [Seongchinamella sediminis]
MTRTPREVISQIGEMRSEWLELTRKNNFEAGLRGLLSELYPDEAHFVYELLQNAEDAEATQVSFELSKTELRFSHNGRRMFTERDVESITGIGESTKKDDVNKVGKFGIGFKAVFAYSDTPQIYSGDYEFQIEHLFCPSSVPSVKKEDETTLFIFPFNNSSKPAAQCYQEVMSVFERMDHTAILFLNNIKSIEWKIQGQAPGLVMRDDMSALDGSLCQISIVHPSSAQLEEDVWFLKYQAPLEGHGNLMCGIALQLGFKKNDQRELKKGTPIDEQMKVVEADGRLCIFFPADKESTGLKFYINGPFASAIDRASVKHDHEDNRKIMRTLSELVVSGLFELKKHKLLNSDLLAVLPINEDTLPKFYEPIRARVHEALSKEALILTRSNSYSPAVELVKGPKALSDVFSDDDVSFLSSKISKKWAVGVLQNSRADKLLSDLKVSTWGYSEVLDDIHSKYWFFNAKKVDTDWLAAKSLPWLRKFYLTLYSAAKRTDSESKLSSHLTICYTNERTVTRFDGVYFPASGKNKAYGYTTLHHDLFRELTKDERTRMRSLFEKLGVSLFGEREEIQNILDSYYSEEVDEDITRKQHSEHMSRFIDYSEKTKNYSIYKDYSIFLSGDAESYLEAQHGFLDKPIKNTGISCIYDNAIPSNARYPLWSGYAKVAGFNNFAIAVGVASSLEIVKSSVWRNPKRSTLFEGMSGSRETHTRTNEDYTITDLESLLDKRDPKIAKLIWDTVRQADPRVLKARYRPNQQYTMRTVSSTLIQMLTTAAWIPDKSNNFKKAQDIRKSDLTSDLEYDDRNGWLTAIGFAEKEKKATADYQLKKDTAEKVFGLSLSDIELLKELKNSPDEYNKVKRKVQELSNPVEFPERLVKNPERRRTKVTSSVKDSKGVKYATKDRSVRESQTSIEPDAWLRETYRNSKNQLICQLCHDVMPFKKRDGEYYMEAVEIASGFKLEREEQHLALCPVCAAKYKEYIKRDSDACRAFLESIYSTEGSEIGLNFGREKASMKFVESHIHDLRVLLDETGLPDG